ncbi:hypothetical protein ACIOC1_04575 [Streptomyces sp. NPDC088197]|uniref:hypothetical protein n=1 Tax=Streptomyces sp. NPDC088197 TaxID=3365840 RepID=UPI003811C38B
MTIAILAALIAALTGGLVTLVEGGRGTAAIKTGALTFTGALPLFIAIMAAMGVVGS